MIETNGDISSLENIAEEKEPAGEIPEGINVPIVPEVSPSGSFITFFDACCTRMNISLQNLSVLNAQVATMLEIIVLQNPELKKHKKAAEFMRNELGPILQASASAHSAYHDLAQEIAHTVRSASDQHPENVNGQLTEKTMLAVLQSLQLSAVATNVKNNKPAFNGIIVPHANVDNSTLDSGTNIAP